MDVNSAFLYGTIEEEVYVCQPPGFEDPQFPDKVYKDKGDILLVHVYVDDIIFGSTKKPLCDEFEQMMHKKFQMSSMGEHTFFLGSQVQQTKDGIFISQDKYVADILKKFDFATVKTTSTPIESNKALIKDEEADSVDVHLYRSMIGSLMYLTASRPDIMFAVCACARFQVTPKMSHLHAVKRIFRYLKGQPKLGLWYPRDSPFDLEAFSDSDYAGASLDRKSTTGEYVAAANCCGQVIKIHTDHNVADLLTKAFDVTKFNFLVASIDKKELAIPGQTATGKEFSNPLMAGSLPKTISAKNTATSKTANSVKQIHVIVDGKAVVISESSVRNDLLFDDEDGITCLTNDDIFENLALMGYEQPSIKLTFQKGSAIPPEPQPTSFISQPNVSEPQTTPLQTETPPIVSHEPQTESYIEQILPSPSTYHRKYRKTQKHRRAKKVTELPQTSVPLDLRADEAVHKEGVTVWKRLSLLMLAYLQHRTMITLSERVLEKPNEPPLPEGHTSGSGEGSMEHTFELMDTVLDLEKEKDAQAVEILKIKQRVKKLERKRKSSISHPRMRIYRQVEYSNDYLDEEDASK
ncbi:putative ribonuclease H-like domain-containing protein [Tanacetum coccineum]